MSGATGGQSNSRNPGQTSTPSNHTGSASTTAPINPPSASSSSSTSSNSGTSNANTAIANSTTAVSSSNTSRPPTSNSFQFSGSRLFAAPSTSNRPSLRQDSPASGSSSFDPPAKFPVFSLPPSPSLFSVPSVRKRFDLAPNYGNSFFTVLVGPQDEATPFSLHELLARTESGFFDAAFRNEWKETEQKAIRLPDHDPEHFQLFFLWIYNRQIFSAKEDDAPKGETDKEWNRLANAWTLGAYLQAPDFRDAVTDAIIEKLSVSMKFGQSMHEVIYPSTDASAPIRKLIVDIATWRWDQSILKTQKHDAAWSEFFFDLSVSQMSNRKNTDLAGSPPWVMKPCAYHEHLNEKSVCYKAERR